MFIKVTKAVLAISGIFFLSMGILWLGASKTLMTQFAIEPIGLLGLNTIRADFGTFFTCLGLFTLGGLKDWKHAETLLYACALLMSIAAFGRLLGMIFDGIEAMMIPPFVVEIVFAGVYVSLARVQAAKLPEGETTL